MPISADLAELSTEPDQIGRFVLIHRLRPNDFRALPYSAVAETGDRPMPAATSLRTGCRVHDGFGPATGCSFVSPLIDASLHPSTARVPKT
ncbi:hypothetical protein A5782_02100 [Mycobacterium sp. 852002-40037_SCH5390672]|nr:hypothetical protein A5782_02100 [Mycobacterium sp. 852002-40037_SCH5390672]